MWSASMATESSYSSRRLDSSVEQSSGAINPCQKAVLFAEVLIEECCCNLNRETEPTPLETEPRSHKSDEKAPADLSNEDDESKDAPSLPTSIYLHADGSPMQVTTAGHGENVVEMSKEMQEPPQTEATTETKGEIVVDEPHESQEIFHAPKIEEQKHVLDEINFEEVHEGQTFIKIKGLSEKDAKSMFAEACPDLEQPHKNPDSTATSDSWPKQKLPKPHGQGVPTEIKKEKSASSKGKSLARIALEAKATRKERTGSRSPSKRGGAPRTGKDSGKRTTSPTRGAIDNRARSLERNSKHCDEKHPKNMPGAKSKKKQSSRNRVKSPVRKPDIRGTDKKGSMGKNEDISKKLQGKSSRDDVPSGTRRLQRGGDDARLGPPVNKTRKEGQPRSNGKLHADNKARKEKTTNNGRQRRDEEAEMKLPTNKSTKSKQHGGKPRRAGVTI